MRNCLQCKTELLKRKQILFCSNKCQSDFRYISYINSWKNGKVKGDRGILSKTLSGHIRRYLFKKNNSKCSICGWSKKHSVTGIVPLEVDHIDGDSDNNTEKNLRLLCPNCHSLTVSYKNLNKGKGRKWRSNKYLKN